MRAVQWRLYLPNLTIEWCTDMPMPGKVRQTEEPTTPASGVRFSMRGLLLTMTAVSVVTAVLGSTARTLDPSTLGNVYVLWGIAAAVVVCRVVYCAWVRIRLEQQAGSILCILKPRGALGWARNSRMSVAIGFLWIGFGVYFLAVAALGATNDVFFPAIACGVLISVGIAVAWWKRSVHIRERGVLYGLRLLQWSHITQWKWEHNSLLLEGVDQRHRDLRIGAVTNEQTLDLVKRIVLQKVSQAGWSGLQKMLREDVKNEESPLVPIQSGQVITMHGLMSAFLAYFLFGLLAFSMFPPVGAASRGYSGGVVLGVAIAAILVTYGSRRVAEAGPPIVRLTRRLDWLSMLITAAVICGGYFAHQRLMFISRYLDVLLGIASGLGISNLAGMITREKIDLCANGIVLIRWTFLPWNGMRLLKWNYDGNGKLLIRSGWRRLAAKVPREHRRFVDLLLQDKIGPCALLSESAAAAITPESNQTR